MQKYIVVLSIYLFFIFYNLNALSADKKHDKLFKSEEKIELNFDPFFQNIVNQVSSDSIISYLQKLESFGIKNPGSTALVNTRDWLYSKYQSFGYTDIAYHDFTYNSNTLQNIIVNKPGTGRPDINLIIDGHYDTINGPGVNDNGSGVAVILEVARLLANIDCEYTIKFINFSAEEQGLRGSQAYVNTVVIPQNMNILLVLNIDEVGGVAGMVNNTITCERDEGSPMGNNAASAAYTDTLAELTQSYSSLNTAIAHAYASDYMPFEDAGYVITGYFETNESPYTHSPNDIIANMDPAYITEITKGAVAAALYFVRVKMNINYYYSRDNKEENLDLPQYQLYPAAPNPFNPFTNIFYEIYKPENVEISVYNIQGQKVKTLFNGYRSRGKYQMVFNAQKYSSGIYFVKMTTQNFKTMRRVILIK